MGPVGRERVQGAVEGRLCYLDQQLASDECPAEGFAPRAAVIVFCPGEQGQPLNPMAAPFPMATKASGNLGCIRVWATPGCVGQCRRVAFPLFPPRKGEGSPLPPSCGPSSNRWSSAADVGFPGDRDGGGSAWWGRARPRACAAKGGAAPGKISPRPKYRRRQAQPLF